MNLLAAVRHRFVTFLWGAALLLWLPPANAQTPTVNIDANGNLAFGTTCGTSASAAICLNETSSTVTPSAHMDSLRADSSAQWFKCSFHNATEILCNPSVSSLSTSGGGLTYFDIANKADLAASPDFTISSHTLTGGSSAVFNMSGTTTFSGAINGVTPESGCLGLEVYCVDQPVTASIGSTTIYSSTSTPVLVRVTYYFSQTQAATTGSPSSSSLYITLFFQDNSSTSTFQESAVLNTNCVPNGGACQGEINDVSNFWIYMGTSVSFTATYASNPSTGIHAAQFQLHIRAEIM